MARTYLQGLVRRMTKAFDLALSRKEISKAEHKALYKSLFFLLAGDPTIHPSFVTFCQKNRLRKAFEDLRFAVGREVKLPQALHARSTKNVSSRNAQEIWKVSKSDMALIEKIAEVAEVDAEAEHHLMRRYYSSLDLHWLAEVEDELEDVDVIINAQALEDLLMGVFETYLVPKSKKEPFSEVFGLCLGMASRQKITKKGTGTRTKWFVYVDKAIPQIRARATYDSVTPNLRSIEAVVETASALFPQLEIIGDYHSHPYRDTDELKRAKGWEVSGADDEDVAWLYRNLREHPRRPHRMRVSFVIAIARGKEVRKGMANPKGLPSVLRMYVAGCHVYISAYRILSNGIMTKRGVALLPTTHHHVQAG